MEEMCDSSGNTCDNPPATNKLEIKVTYFCMITTFIKKGHIS